MRTVGILCLPGKCSPDTDGPSSHRILFQKRILEDYAQKNSFTNIRHFTDDGVRGTTFKRPGLDAMLEEIRAGNVANITDNRPTISYNAGIETRLHKQFVK